MSLLSPQLLSLTSVTTLAAATTTASFVSLPGGGSTVRLVNAGHDSCFVSAVVSEAGTATSLPTATSPQQGMLVLPGTDTAFSVPDRTYRFLSVICPSSSCTLYVSAGEGQ